MMHKPQLLLSGFWLWDTLRLAAGFSHRPFGLRGQITAVAVGCFNWHFAIMQPRPWTGHANPEKRNKNPTLAPISEEMGHHGHTMCMVHEHFATQGHSAQHQQSQPSTNTDSPAPTHSPALTHRPAPTLSSAPSQPSTKTLSPATTLSPEPAPTAQRQHTEPDTA